jgi:hypothetical protein
MRGLILHDLDWESHGGAHRVAPEAASEVKLRWRLGSICTNRYSLDDLMMSHCFIWVVRMWCGIHTNPILRCFMDPEGLNYRDLLVGVVLELVS